MFQHSDVFISYSRKDTDFAQRIFEALQAQKREVWVDWNDIPLTADWWKEIQQGIEHANTFIFVISPDSIQSDVCYKEIDYAVSLNKRIVPVLYREIDLQANGHNMHNTITTHNWVQFGEEDDFDEAFTKLITALETDLPHVRRHTQLLLKAREWEARNRDVHFLLRRVELLEAETWLNVSPDKEPAPTRLHREFITYSRIALSRRRRNILLGSGTMIIIACLALLSFALFQQSETNAEQALARSTELAFAVLTSESNAVIAGDARGTAENLRLTARSDAFFSGRTAVAALGTSEARGTEVAQQAATSDFNAQAAATNAAEAAQTSQRARAIALVAQSENALSQDNDQLALLLSIEALTRYPYTWAAERVLGTAIRSQFVQTDQDNLSLHPKHVRQSPTRDLYAEIEDQRVHILENITERVQHSLTGHTDRVTQVVWSPDGMQLATLSADRTAIIWDATNGNVVRVLVGHTEAIFDAVWLPGGNRIVTIADDTTLRLWNLETGDLPLVFNHGWTNLAEIRSNPDGIIVFTENDVPLLWELWDEPADLVSRARNCCIERPLTREEALLYNVPTPTSVPSPETLTNCPDVPASQLYPGAQGSVNNASNSLALRVRSGPDTSQNVLGFIQPDQTFQVLEGPVCESGFAWFKVVYGIDASTGWLAEGGFLDDGTPDYFALPLPNA